MHNDWTKYQRDGFVVACQNSSASADPTGSMLEANVALGLVAVGKRRDDRDNPTAWRLPNEWPCRENERNHVADVCEHCEGQRFDRAQVLLALHAVRVDLRGRRGGKKVDGAPRWC
jgi:hypothetical protein